MDNRIMQRIVEKLKDSIAVPLSICDVSGRVIVSTEPSRIGQMDLLALEALNINSRASAAQGNGIQSAGAAVPLCFRKSRLGAMVIEGGGSVEIYAAEFLAKTIEILYEEYAQSEKDKSRSLERDQFLYEWLHLSSEYTDSFKKRGEQLGIDVEGPRTVIVMEPDPDDYPLIMPMVQKLLEPDDIMMPLSQQQDLIILRENAAFEKRYHRIASAISCCHAGVCSGEGRLYTAYRFALKSLHLGKILFPSEYLHTYEKMRLAVALSELDIPGMEEAFSRLVVKGKNARLAETAVTYIRFNGDIQKICERLHIHRNSIPYRLRRIQAVSGRNLLDSYDLLYLYGSFIHYIGKMEGEIT
ncbi:MAG TPA: helix-turn-helix domain-containing protein [Candidatus Lachnoclostridium stercoravium]|uniref:Helix-turn-helix domain-containing protein n=1 Tax=Candidatus Lachnoclostridium stercoravium TaxID=2838633 RepID=A0A9D2HGY0_9FIRM|nr:helix-turn-helix domain-containing protein [Candidatus Lachnoclostridium stercoravium]